MSDPSQAGGENQPGHLMHDLVERDRPRFELAGRKVVAVFNTPPDAPAPRQVLRSAVSRLAEHFAPDGFAHFKSKNLLRKREGDLDFQLIFETHRHNIRGYWVFVSPYVLVDSNRLKDWRGRYGVGRIKRRLFITTEGWVVRAMVHNIVSEDFYQQYPPTFRWNVADPAEFEPVTDDIADFMRIHALPYFALFREPEQVIAELITGAKNNRGLTSIPGFDLWASIEYTLCFGTLEQASAILHRNYELCRNLQGSEVEQRFAMFKQDGLDPSHIDGPGFQAEMAEIRANYDL